MNGNQSREVDGSGISPGEPEVSLRDQQKALTRQRIVRAARNCFLSEGVAGTSFDAIARRAGVSRATVYLHYASKEALLLAMLAEDWQAQCALYASLPGDAARPAAFAQWLRVMVTAYQRQRDFMGLYALVLGQEPALAAQMELQRQRLLRVLGEHFPAFDVESPVSPEQKLDAYLMLGQIEQFCLMAMRDDWADIVEPGIDMLATRLAAFVRGGPVAG